MKAEEKTDVKDGHKRRTHKQLEKTDLPNRLLTKCRVMGITPLQLFPGMGNVTSPGDPGSLDSFTDQATGSGDIAFPIPDEEDEDEDEKKKKKKKKKKLKYVKEYNEYVSNK